MNDRTTLFIDPTHVLPFIARAFLMASGCILGGPGRGVGRKTYSSNYFFLQSPSTPPTQFHSLSPFQKINPPVRHPNFCICLPLRKVRPKCVFPVGAHQVICDNEGHPTPQGEEWVRHSSWLISAGGMRHPRLDPLPQG